MSDEKKKNIPAKDIQQLLQQLALSSPDAKKKEAKAPQDYKFWTTQPVPQFKEPNLLQTTDDSSKEGPILPDEVCRASVKSEPEKLIDGFEWTRVDLDQKDEIQELYDLLYNHYVEDTDGTFRFNYSVPFLQWALKPPGWKKEWHVGVRTKASAEGKKGKLVAFISAIPATVAIHTKKMPAVEINFLAVHRKLRLKRLTPVMIKEITRQCYMNGLYQALYTGGTVLPVPFTTCRYFHRALDWPYLYKNGFSALPPRSTETQQVRKYFLPSKTEAKGLRPMKPEDVPAVSDLLNRYLERFQIRQEFTEEETAHCLCSEASRGVVYSYVVEQNGKITDFISYYLLESTVLKADKKQYIRAAYLYYYASEAAFAQADPKAKGKAADDGKPPAQLSKRLNELVHDVLVLAKKDGYHVFNALTLLDNPYFLKEQKFEPGDGKLHFYLFNYRTPKIPGGIDEANQIDFKQMGGVGVVMI